MANERPAVGLARSRGLVERLWSTIIGSGVSPWHRYLPDLVPALSAGKSLPRAFMERKLRDVRLRGRVLDLGGGGSRNAHYTMATDGVRVFTADVRAAGRPDIVANLEQGLPLRDGSVDVVLLLNVIEHIFRYEAVIAEVGRVISAEGVLYLFVPFLYPRHTAAYDEFNVEDYFRFGPVALKRLLTNVGGFLDVQVEPCSYGPSLAAADVIAAGLSRKWLRMAGYSTGALLDRLLFVGRRPVGNATTEWPVAFWVCARKASRLPVEPQVNR
jgi:SAM-dependent methyltransferase